VATAIALAATAIASGAVIETASGDDGGDRVTVIGTVHHPDRHDRTLVTDGGSWAIVGGDRRATVSAVAVCHQETVTVTFCTIKKEGVN
jgi:hypothetical protein